MDDICDLLGIEKRRIRGLTSVLCPFHDDQNFGSAFIRGNRIKCYACGSARSSYDIFDVYMNRTGLSLLDAAAEISRQFGLADVTFQKKFVKGMPFNRDELTAIGLLKEDRRKEEYPVSIQETPDKKLGYTVRKETTLGYSFQERKVVAVVDDYVVSKKGQSMYKHLQELYENDRRTFYWMVRNKCREHYAKYYSALMTVSLLQGALSEKGVRNELLDYQYFIAVKRLSEIQRIYDKTKWKKIRRPSRKAA